MRSVLLIAALTVLLLAGLPGHAEQTYGSRVTLGQTTKVSDILGTPGPYVGKKVLVEGMVVEVCAKRGCWLELASDKAHQQMKIKVDDGVIVFPMSARGKTALVEGVVEELTLSKQEALEQARHYAQESGKPFDPASVKGPTTEYRIKATGAVIR